MRILLINSPVSRMSPHAYVSPPLGLAYLAGHLRRAGHEVEIIDLNLTGYNQRRVDVALERVQPDLVGVSAYTETYPNALLIAAQVKAYDASTTVVFGGPHPSIMPEAVLAEPTVDYVIVGEGEIALAELVVALQTGGDMANIAGLVWRKDGIVVTNPRRALLNPDTIGLPARDLLSLEFYADPLNVLTARGGCPYRCPFCSASHIWSGKHLPRRPQAVVDELEMLIRDYGAQYVFFVDDIFTLNKRWVYRLLEALSGLSYPITWGCATRVDLVDEKLLAEMAAAGCRGIQFGVESGAENILDSVKGISKQQVLKAVTGAVVAGIDVVCSFMAPFPEDTLETLRETGEFMKVVKDAGSRILLSYTVPYPGTQFYDRAEELGLTILTDKWEEFDAKHLIIETKNLSGSAIDAAITDIVRGLGLQKSTA